MTKYFNGCNDLNALKARYRELAKAYHPDLHPEMGDDTAPGKSSPKRAAFWYYESTNLIKPDRACACFYYNEMETV